MWPESEKTAELLAHAQQGNADAGGQALERHRDALRRLVQMRLDRRVQQRVDVSDVVQDVMIEASQRLAAYLANPVMPFHLWLRHMTRDRIIDMHRRHRVSAKRSVDREQPLAVNATNDRSTIELAAQICDAELTPAAAATMRELAARFEAAIEDLDEKDREVVLMRHFEQLSNQEVAQALGLSEPAASMRYLRAIRRLRELIGQAAEE
ncbi:MAG: sigma-70 family RNA polymerase sigma factor [Planctomycetales bacterium]|nr:sigma-70 family RNA polymerase sigma factor [Planctomycetales bacterium]